MNMRHALLLVGLVAAAGIALFGDKSPSNSAMAEAVVRSKQMAAPTPTPIPAVAARAQVAKTVPSIQAVTPRVSTEATETPDARVTEAGLFASKDWTPPPPKARPQVEVPPPPPAAPPLPFTYLGKSMAAGLVEVFLARGNQTLIVHSKSQIDANYRVESIDPPLLKLVYLPLNQVQQINIGAFD